MSDKELLIKELIVKDFNEILVNEFCTDWKEKRLYIELLVRATHFDYLLNYIQEKDKETERLNNIIDKATGIANERINYCYHENGKEQLESWEEIFDILQELKGK